MKAAKKNLRDMTVSDLEGLCTEHEVQKFRARQVFKWLYKGIKSIDEMSDIPLDFRNILKESFYIGSIEIEKKFLSQKDGTVKYLLKLKDGNIIESVLMKYGFGISVCLSTQVGCRMGCSFCASTIGGLIRNLTPGEVIDEVLTMQEDCQERISNIVLMGSGEPFDNYANIIKFLKIVNDKDGLNIGMRHITLSTCGLVPEIIKLGDLNLQLTLAVSLHAPNDEIRREIMPVANKYAINDIIDACRYYINKTNRRITFEYSMIKGVNDGIDNAYELAELLKGLLCHVNLIPINEIEESKHKKSHMGRVNEFKKILENKGIEVTVRRELGADINAACGQLRKNYVSNNRGEARF
ncbi:putative dual-specificity RNA methyltransferase RlmN [Oxobacter pfennigii]|uniref:Probable dual-specificity RNA methyltransferase RlmN n=1 Tax=Oxobacter pfennigii TaxID=36849 RepID=A0A0P8WN56_9CLOT|nr:23S rRNA (adenine(2503)-C(2))-methyltransferase RlmN [Oxobacter pfennigii]KPU43975.1 putative dual-specificity RNA methyltransferase RlmN [Oxobacter pfennigii]